MRLVYLGSGAFGLPTLKQLHRVCDVAQVVTQPDRPAGRGRGSRSTPIGEWADKHGLTLVKTPDANAVEFVARMKAAGADAAVVVAFGQKLSPALIEALGPLVINLHASLLPKYRGAAPINWAIINGESVTGLSVISLAQRMDAGLIYGQAKTRIDPHETAGELHDRLAEMGPELVCQVLQQFQAGSLEGEPQDEAGVSKAPKLSKADGKVDFAAPAGEVCRRIHGLTPWPGVTVSWRPAAGGDSRSLKLLRAQPAPQGNPRGEPPGRVLDELTVATGDGSAVRLLSIQPAGGRAMTIEAFARGHGLEPGDTLRS